MWQLLGSLLVLACPMGMAAMMALPVAWRRWRRRTHHRDADSAAATLRAGA